MDPQQTTSLVDMISKVGTPAALITLCTILLPSILPTLLRRWKAQTQQTLKMTETLPRIESHLHSMATHGQASQHVLEELLRGQTRQEGKLDKLLELRRH